MTEADKPSDLAPGEALEILRQVDPASALYRYCREVLEGQIEVEPKVLVATPPRAKRFLTIGMATYNDYDGWYFTMQSIRLHHPEILDDVEFLVIDNNPAGPAGRLLKAFEYWDSRAYRYVPQERWQGTAVRDLLFREASGDFVLCVDSHVLFEAGALARLILYCRRNSGSRDLLQGPVLDDVMSPMATHFKPGWSDGMWGSWDLDPRGKYATGQPFDIPMQGLGVFACRREAWPGFNPRLAGFGGEEGYIHEKIRRAGGRNLCLPFLRWVHRFERPSGLPYVSTWDDRIRNYSIIHEELGLDKSEMVAHFEQHVGAETTRKVVAAVEKEINGPFHFFEAIYCINPEGRKTEWARAARHFEQWCIHRKVRRFRAVETPPDDRIGLVLSHRRIVVEARKYGLQAILVLDDDVRFSPDCREPFLGSLEALKGRDWQILSLGGERCGTRAVAYHGSGFDALLDAIPEDPRDAAVWLAKHGDLDHFYRTGLGESVHRFVTEPVLAGARHSNESAMAS